MCILGSDALIRFKASPALNLHTSPDDPFDGARVDLPFGLLDPGMERCGSVVVEDGDGGLHDDGAGIDALIDKVDCAAGDFYTVVECLFPGLQPREGRE